MDNRIPRFRNRAHWTPRYVKDRLALMLTDLLHPDWPMLTKDAILWLDKCLTKDMVGVEFGGGRSTLWLAKRLRWLVSVEHDSKWQRKANNVTNILTDNFPDCAKTIKFVLDQCDFALIDGEQRDKCALAIIDKLKSGGVLVVDDIERYFPNKKREGFLTEDWELFSHKVAHWKLIWTTNGIRDTAIWIKS